MATRIGSRPAMVGLVLVLGAGVALGQSPGGGGGSPQSGQQSQPQSQTQPGANSPGAANPNDPTSPLAAANGQGSMRDKDFFKEAGQGGNFEIQAGQLAAQKGNSEDVKQFGQMMVDDHTKLNQQMTPIAAQLAMKPPTGVSSKDKKELKKLQGLSGDDFDKEYIAMMVKDHTADQKAFKDEADNGQLPEEKSAATQGGSVVSQHLDKIKQIAQAHNVSVSGT